MLNKDRMVNGAAVGIIMPFLFFCLLYIFDLLANSISGQTFIHRDYIPLVCFSVNLIALRYFIVNKKQDKTGRGVLLVTFIFVMFYFAFKREIYPL